MLIKNVQQIQTNVHSKSLNHENGDFIKKNKCQVGGGRWGKGRMDGGKLSPRGSWTDVGFVSSILKLLTPFIHQ